MDLEFQLQTTQALLLSLYTSPIEDKELHQIQVKHYTKKFKALLAQKARQKVVNHVRNHNSSNAQNTCASETNNARPCISIRDILKQKIARCR